MRVLLLHEMSGVHTELKAGLIEIGIDTKIATFGDGWKKYRSDISLGLPSGIANGAINKIHSQIKLLKSLNEFDVVQSIAPIPFFSPLNQQFQAVAANQVDKFFYIAAGSDAIYRKHVRSLPYYPPHDWYENIRAYKNLDRSLRRSSGIIPVCYEYEYCMKKDGRNPQQTTPFPINISKHKSSKLATERKLKIFHPLNRLDPQNDFKGTSIIKCVFDRLSLKYSDVAEFIILGGLPHEEYSKLTDGVDIIVDQLNSMSYGMSAAYGLAKGKVVLSGLEKMTRNVEHYGQCPVINVIPDADDLFEKIEALIIDRSRIRMIGEHSRSYARQFHDHIKVATKFAKLYQS
ncbi:MAG: hypothetical protein P8N75_05980 [Ascidiaceihabitans sp.]|nr:hypothetical protein [Ascidiaceihabitans sp.]